MKNILLYFSYFIFISYVIQFPSNIQFTKTKLKNQIRPRIILIKSVVVDKRDE